MHSCSLLTTAQGPATPDVSATTTPEKAADASVVSPSKVANESVLSEGAAEGEEEDYYFSS